MASFPQYRLYDETGTSLVYNFECVTDDTDGSPFFDPADFVEHVSLRGQGSQISQGSNEPFDITLTFVLTDDDYEGLVAQMEALNTTIVKFTKYILKVDLTSGGSTRDIKVLRLTNFRYPSNSRKKRVKFQYVVATFRALTWA